LKNQLIKETLKNINIEESDLIGRPDDWNQMKKSFTNNVVTLIQNIENDEYKDAEDVINNTIATLRFWKGKIQKGSKDKKDDLEYDNAFSKFGNITKKHSVIDENNSKKEIYKADGITFNSYEEVEKYAKENNKRIINTNVITHKGVKVHLVDLTSTK
jgi:hypothetical protein